MKTNFGKRKVYHNVTRKSDYEYDSITIALHTRTS